MTVFNYEYQTHYLRGISTINDPKDTKQEGLLLYLRDSNDKRVVIYLDKRDLAHIAKSTTEARRKFWKRFRLPKMVEQKAIDKTRY